MSSTTAQSEKESEDETPFEQESRVLSHEEFNMLIGDTVSYVLLFTKSKYPIKRQSIVKDVLREHGRYFRRIIQEAENVLLAVYGYALVDVEDNGQRFVLLNQIQNSKNFPHLSESNEEKAKRVLLMLVLSFIYMIGTRVREDGLMSFLAKLKIVGENNEVHPYFGDVKHIIKQEFVRQMYLECTRISGFDPPKYEFQWGKRAEKELDRLAVLEFVCQLYDGQCKPTDWICQYEEAVRRTEREDPS